MYPDDDYRPNNETDPGSTSDSGTSPASTPVPGEAPNSGTGSAYTPGYNSGEWHGSPYGAGASNSYGSTGGGYGASYASPTPPQPPKPAKPPKAKRLFSGGKVVALCLVCALLGGCASGGVFALISSRNQSAAPAGTSTILESGRTPTTTVQTSHVQNGEKMSVADIYANYSGSVVCIEVSSASGSGAGTGFVITDDGYIVTCYHVIDGAQEISVTFSDNTSYQATLVGGDEDNDIAVLKIDASGLKPVVLGDSDLLNVGDTVTTIGNALGTLSNTTTTGIVSALDRAISMSDGTVMNVLQTNCTVNSGNSGGPLFNEYGEVIGIVNAKYSSSGYSSTASIEGIGFAIPYADVKDKITDLMQYGYITGKPSLGITVSTVTPLEAQRFNMVVGAYVNSVAEGSCAQTAGLQQGDIITGVDGEEITTYEELVNAKNQRSAGDQMTLNVWRAGEVLTITVTLDEQKPQTNSGDSQTAHEGQDSQSGQNYNNMTPEDFFNYWFGGRSNGGW